MSAHAIPLGGHPAQMLLFPDQLTAVQHISRLRGGSQAQLIRASDNGLWVVKFLGNPQHDRVLANEFFASRLGQHLSLPLPDVELIEVSDDLIRRTPELYVESASCNKPWIGGLHLASRFAGNPETDEHLDYLPESLFSKVVNRLDFARILVLDKWTSNADGRQAVFVKHPGRTEYFAAHFIDQGYSFNAGEWSFPDLALHGIYHRNYVYQDVTSWENFEPALTAAEEMDQQEIWECAAPIPSEWCGPAPDALPKLVEDLYRRRSLIRNLITAFRYSSRDPFPRWAGN